jgi:peptidoglycan/xylan/chitin deacetylase (PgdA/CDA1 family)
MRPAAHDQAESTATMFSSSRRLAIAEHFRIPYEVIGGPAGARLESLRAVGGQELLWTSVFNGAAAPVSARIETGGSSIPIFARLVSDSTAEGLLAGSDDTWSRAASLVGEDGQRIASIWRAREGSVFLPFDPDEVCETYWSERYLEVSGNGARRRIGRGIVHAYYGVRSVLPRSTQIWLRRRYARIQARSRFPSWPVETAMHDFFDLFTAILSDVAGGPVPRIAPWPHGHSWALVLTHDVETSEGFAAIDPITNIERGLGLRSSWNFVPRRYHVDDDRVRELSAGGFEVGVHGLHHDGRDLESLARVEERLPEIRTAAGRWRAVGFRAPATQRQWELMPMLGFDYDSSYPDTDPFEPQGGGCCTWLPFFNQEMVELPLTMPQDHTLFVILRRDDETAWTEKAEFLRSRGGMALIDTHPDYLIEDRIRSAYRRLLERYAVDESAWKALPREVSDWWRRRADSSIERAGDGWVVKGPAVGEARVELQEGAPWS